MSNEKEILSWNNVFFKQFLEQCFSWSEIEIEWLVTYPSVCAQIPTRPVMKQEIFRFP